MLTLLSVMIDFNAIVILRLEKIESMQTEAVVMYRVTFNPT